MVLLIIHWEFCSCLGCIKLWCRSHPNKKVLNSLQNHNHDFPEPIRGLRSHGNQETEFQRVKSPPRRVRTHELFYLWQLTGRGDSCQRVGEECVPSSSSSPWSPLCTPETDSGRGQRAAESPSSGTGCRRRPLLSWEAEVLHGWGGSSTPGLQRCWGRVKAKPSASGGRLTPSLLVFSIVRKRFTVPEERMKAKPSGPGERQWSPLECCTTRNQSLLVPGVAGEPEPPRTREPVPVVQPISPSVHSAGCSRVESTFGRGSKKIHSTVIEECRKESKV